MSAFIQRLLSFYNPQLGLLIGNNGNNNLNSGDGNDSLTGAQGGDILAGGQGSDTFIYAALNESLLNSYDRITDLVIGTDRLDARNSVASGQVALLGTVSALTSTAISAVLTSSTFKANGAATFTFGTGASQRTFLALNDGIAGFSSSADSIIEITGYSGSLSNLAIL